MVNKVSAKDLKKSKIEGYSWKEVESQYGGVKQRWLVVESQKRKESDKIKLSEKIEKEKEKATKKLNSLMKQKFNSSEGATEIGKEFANSLKYHQIPEIKIRETQKKSNKKKESSPEKIYQITTFLEVIQSKIDELQERAGRFILATNQLDKSQLSEDDILTKYKEQQAPE